MEPENNNQELAQTEHQVEQKSSLHQVTPLSKYLAMALFIILPFVGGWVGYTFAPEKVVEVEKIIETEKVSEVDSVTTPGVSDAPSVEDPNIVSTTTEVNLVRDGELVSGPRYRGIAVIGDVPAEEFAILPIFSTTTDSDFLMSQRYVTLSVDPTTVYLMSLIESDNGWIHLGRLEGSDASSLRTIPQPEGVSEAYKYFNPYVADDSRVYYLNIPLEGADPNNFIIEEIDLGDTGGIQYFGNSNGQYYYRDVKISDNNLDAVQVFAHPRESQNTDYFKDAQNVYFIGYEFLGDYDREAVILTGADTDKFYVKEFVLGQSDGTRYFGMTDTGVWTDAKRLQLSVPDMLFYYNNTIVSDGQRAYYMPISYRPLPRWICEIAVEDIHIESKWTCDDGH